LRQSVFAMVASASGAVTYGFATHDSGADYVSWSVAAYRGVTLVPASMTSGAGSDSFVPARTLVGGDIPGFAVTGITKEGFSNNNGCSQPGGSTGTIRVGWSDPNGGLVNGGFASGVVDLVTPSTSSASVAFACSSPYVVSDVVLRAAAPPD